MSVKNYLKSIIEPLASNTRDFNGLNQEIMLFCDEYNLEWNNIVLDPQDTVEDGISSLQSAICDFAKQLKIIKEKVKNM